MTSRSRRGGESRKNNPASGSNNDQENDVHSGSQGTGTSDNSEISHPLARGIVSMLKVKKNRTKGILVKLNWNELGQPIGKESMTLAHYVGALARRTFPITITDFRKKELAPAKEAFWDEIVATFTGLDENHKKTIISRAGCYHRLFRTRLRSLARDDNGNYSAQPPILYRELSTVTPYWNDFVEQALKEEFMEKSKKNKERAEAMEARYKSACVGYARLREKIIAERIQKGEKNPVVTRLELWEAARTNADGVVDDPEALQILEDVGEREQAVCAREQEKEKVFVKFQQMAKIGKWRVKRKVAETPPDSGDHTGDNTGSTRPSLTPSSSTPHPEHNLSKIRKYPTQTTMSLLAQCGTRSSPRLRKPIRKVKGTMTPPRTCLIEITHNLNSAVPPEPQIRMCGADFSMSSNQGESSKSKELPLTSADLEQIDQVVTNVLDALQGSNPLIPPPTAAHEVAPMFSMPLNMESAVVGNQTDVEGSCKNGNEQSNMRLARSSSLGNAYATDEVNSSVYQSLVTLQEGYRVKEQVAPLLRKIFSKFGDIAKDSSQQSIPIRSMYLENVCSIYQDLEMKKNLTQITSLEIQKHLVVVADCEAVNVQVGWLRKRLQDISVAEEELSMIKDKKAVKARKTVEEEMVVKKLEESKKKTRLLEIVAEESRKKDQLLESEVASIRAEKRESEEAIENAREKIQMFIPSLVDGLLPM